jgi:pimeloyl-ACP methyl ester carboxylesterase
MSTTYPRQLPLLGNSHAVQGSTHMTAVWGRTRNHDLPVVLTMGGWPGTTPFQVGLTAASQMPLIAAGYTIITPWAGANWGHPTTASAPSSGPAGTGLTAMDDAITWATAQDLNATTVHIYGTSMGGLNSIAWAKDNPDAVGGIFLLAPVLDIMHIYDVAGDSIPPYGTAPDYVPSIHTAWSTASRAATVTATAGMDPARNLTDPGLLEVGARTAIYAARDDDIVGEDPVQNFADATGADLTWSAGVGEAGGGHVLLTLADAWDEHIALRTFAAWEP